MKNLLIFIFILLILYLVYRNIKIVGREAAALGGGEGGYVAWDWDKYSTCRGCCKDDEGCKDSRCWRPGKYKGCKKKDFVRHHWRWGRKKEPERPSKRIVKRLTRAWRKKRRARRLARALRNKKK